MDELQTNEAPSGSAYATKQIAVATFLGGPLAGCWLLALNYRLFKQSGNALFSIVGGMLATIAVLAVSLVLPPWLPKIVLPVAYSLAMRGLAQSLQGSSLDEHIRNGGRVGSWWIVVGISVLCIAIMFGLVFAALLLFPNAIPVE
jgi:hypothetical protein